VDETQSQGSIGLVSCLAFAVGSMVGGGVFTLSGTALNKAGPAALLAYGIAGVVMLLSAVSFVAVAGRAKPGDSGYGPVADILGPVWRFLVMWGFYLNGLTLLTFLLVSFGDYLNHYFLSAVGPIAAGLVAAGAITALNLGPAGLVAKAENAIVGLKLSLLFFFVAWGLAKIGNASFSPFVAGGSDGVFKASALLFTAYTGFNVVTNMAGSVKNPTRTVPMAVIGSVLISAIVYIGVALAMVTSGVGHFGAEGVGQAADALMGNWGGYLIAFAACLSTLSGANANLLGASEVMLRLVRQGDAPPAAGRTNKAGNPVASVFFIGAVTVVLVLVANVNSIVVYANVAALVAMLIVNVATLRLWRQGWPGEGMKLPGGPALPLIAIVACLAQFPSLGWGSVAIGLGLVLSGLLLYFNRHRTKFGEEARVEVEKAIKRVDTPLARAMRGLEGEARRIRDDLA
jgi:basic amino acid/polyamine antiporter, APA family